MEAFFNLISRLGRFAIFVTITWLLQGCIISGDKLDKMGATATPENSVDYSMMTGSVASQTTLTSDPIILSDQLVIRDEIKAIENVNASPKEVKWDNTITGSEGTISSIVESKDKGRKCRKFQATRSAYDGENLYHGEICEMAPDVWTMTSFDMAH
ncbi:Surface antigen domain [Bartonella apihabitans]|uniref:RT0821/Lpp0805 family surface protein n=1 Tax=Bartonella apihabitans TaxID=2750929 RepID=UPI003998CBE4